ncbi:unnamed protein product [Acanthoscelides obtectus]|uniref:Uncharacterized protein n=1 Tax=Acanthoscelides obtectus TaxID=200917 RepID=A0A9P0LS23_ACAOB|nr:unnamed protein product [Acanthoscelides obtectus]CAK1669023.1 hypothetical protein AOBTE_LOCUS26749 [Acanthoscelides obtectus]
MYGLRALAHERAIRRPAVPPTGKKIGRCYFTHIRIQLNTLSGTGYSADRPPFILKFGRRTHGCRSVN